MDSRSGPDGLSPGQLCRLVWILAVTILVVLAGQANADRRNPLKDPSICGRPDCPSDDTAKFRYNTTFRYTYNYRMHVRTEFSGSGQNTSDVFVLATAELTFPTRCEGVLHLENVQLRNEAEKTPRSSESDEPSTDYYEYSEPESDQALHPKNVQFGAAVTENNLRFSFHDGVIAEVCPSDNEENWILNFKKGILSAMQNTMYRFDIDYNGTETDVTGKCDVAYKLHGASGTSLLLQKFKDIASCTNRYKTNSFLQTVPYDFRQNFAVWPILNSESICNISVDHNIYKEVTCFERHQLVPFSNQQSGAVTSATIHLNLASERQYDPKSQDEETLEITTRSPLIFNHLPTLHPTHGEIRTARELLKRMCSIGFPLIKRDFIEVFTQFLQTTRQLSHTALQQLLNRADSICYDSQNGKYHVLESLPYIGSTASVQIMRDEILKGTVPPNIVHTWLHALSYLPRPDREILAAFLTMLPVARAKTDPKFVLVATAITHTFCRNNPGCRSVSEVQSIVAFLENELQAELARDFNQRRVRERITVLLKGIGNVGVTTDTLAVHLQDIILNAVLPIEVRLQSIYAHIRMDCSSVRNFFLDIYEDYDENSEIRIAAYQRVMLCPTYSSVQRIKNILRHEEVNQVGSYVWSHLHNLAKSASPMNVEAQGLLVDEELASKFRLDIRKFSRNYEQSVFFDEYNFGVRSDADLVFGTESYMPRRVAFNLTADLFGESVNLVEVSTRMQGFEHMVESIFGPKGPLNTKGFNEKFGFISKYWADTVNSEDSDIFERFNIRMRRNSEQSPKNDSDNSNVHDNLRSSISRMAYKPKYNFNEPRASIGLKIFGNDLEHLTIEGESELLQAVYKYNPIHQMRAIFSGREINYTKSGVFLDVSYDVPLLTGMPLSIQTFGASSVDLRMSGKLKDPNFLYTRSIDVEGKIKPSVSLDVTSTMQSDYFYGSSGVRVKCNLYSSSSVDAKLKIKGSQMASLQFSLPQDRNDIFSARSELLVITHDRDLPQRGISQRYSNSTCTWPFIDRAVGLQVCAEYSLPDVNNASIDYPSLLLSGPVNLNIHLDKADLSAKTFLFEYRWDTFINSSHGSLSFNTPGSVIPRVFSANITSKPESYNVSMSFRNGALEHAAVGSYSNTPDEKKLEVYLNLNGQKNLAFEMGMNRSEVRNGWIYFPNFLLAVNNERIAGLMGAVKITDKKNIVQYDINLTFETKRVQAHLMGYVTNTEVSFSPKLTLSYMFLESKKELIEIEGELANRSDKSRSEYDGFMRVNSTAYPKFNFASHMKFLSVLGHIEAKLELNNAANLKDPEYSLTLRTVLAHHNELDPKTGTTKTAVTVEVTRPKSNVAFRFKIKHEGKYKNGPFHNFLASLRVAPKKEGTAVLSLHFPNSKYFEIDAAFNVTVPTFGSCTSALRLIEKSPRDYGLDFRGSWFSGHSIALKGFYQDKSSTQKTFHHLKLVVNSPLFNETNIDATFWRDESDLSFDLQTEHGADKYALDVKHSNRNLGNRVSNVRLVIVDKVYTVRAQVQTDDGKHVLLEINLDKIRNIVLSLTGVSNDLKKEGRIEVQWDANRDPTQKIAFAIELNTPSSKSMDGGFQIAYPERTFSGSFDSRTVSPEWTGNARFAWSSYETVAIRARLGVNFEPAKELWASVHLSTPFEGWQSNSVDTGLYLYNNRLLTNGSLVWGDGQHLGLAVVSNYEHDDPNLKLEFKLDLNSTVQEVPTASALFKHSTTQKRIDTDIKIKHSPFNETAHVFSIRSGWQFDAEAQYRNVTGSIAMRSPVDGYKTGVLSAKFSMTDNKQMCGGLDIDLEEKKYAMIFDGYAKKFTDSMFMINITTPIEKFRRVAGRFGISERRRHYVAEVRMPTNALGAEILWDIVALADFNVKLNVETPLEGFQKAMIIGKMKPDTVDLRGGWNHTVLGYVGVWRMVNLTDFEYSYKVFTPFDNFTENGFVAKFVKRDGFDLELSGKFSKYKLGVIANARPKPSILGLRISHAKARNELMKETELVVIGTSEEEGDDDDDEGLLNYIGAMELDTLVWPTIIGSIELEEVGDIYNAHGMVKIPYGNVEFWNRLEYPDYFNIKNSFNLNTPFSAVPNIKLRYNQIIEMGSFYFSELDIEYLKFTHRVEFGLLSNYSKVLEESDLKSYDYLLKLKTPIPQLEKIDFHSNLELDDSVYRGQVSTRTPNTFISLGGAFESAENFLETAMSLSLTAPTVPKFDCSAKLKKELSDVENVFVIEFNVHENDTFNMLHIETAWQIDNPNYVKASGKLTTTLVPIKQVSSTVLLSRTPNPTATADFQYLTAKGHEGNYHLRAVRKVNYFTVDITTPLQGFGNVSLAGTISPSTSGSNTIEGKLFRNSIMYDVTGNVRFDDDIPTEASLDFVPIQRIGQESSLTYSLTDSNDGTSKKVQFRANEGNHFANLNTEFSYHSNFNWKLAAELQSSNGVFTELETSVLPSENGYFIGLLSLKTPFKELGIDSILASSEINLRSTSGDISHSLKSTQMQSRSTCSWTWIPLQHMEINIDTSIIPPRKPSRQYTGSLKYQDNSVPKSTKTSGRTHLTVGIHLDVDSRWRLQSNATVRKLPNELGANLNVRLPVPVADMHKFIGQYRGNLGGETDNMDIEYDIKYETDVSARHFASRGQYRNVTDLQGAVRFEWGHDKNRDAAEANVQMLRKELRREFSARVLTPFHVEETMTARGSYDISNSKHLVTAHLNYPASVRVAETDIAFQSLANMKGNVNSTTPFHNLAWLRGDFEFITTGAESNRFLKATWPKDTAHFDMKSTFTATNVERDVQGTIDMEMPLASRHITAITYELKNRASLTDGKCLVKYNGHQVLDGGYTSKSESRSGVERGVVDITLKNDRLPLGISYSHEQSNGEEHQYNMKRAEVFDLRNSKLFNITGELHIRTTATGQDYKVVAIHPNRTVILTSRFDIQERVTNTNSRLQLADNVWIAYNVIVENRTQNDNESQNFHIELAYPKRNLTTVGWYSVTDNTFDTDLTFKWTDNLEEAKQEIEATTTEADAYNWGYASGEVSTTSANKPRIMRAALHWRNEPLMGIDTVDQTIELSILHPSFQKDVTFKGKYFRDPVELFRAHVEVDYCDEPEHLLTLHAVAKDLTGQVGYRNYSFNLLGEHAASELDLKVQGSVGVRPGLYEIENQAHYKRSYLPIQEGSLIGMVNMRSKEIHYWKITPQKTVRIWGRAGGQFPVYHINGTMEDSPDLNSTGRFYLNIADKLVQLNVNMTPDASQNLRMVGTIPNARSASFDFWRDYEEFRIVDVAYYLRMNHSRLITSQLLWRPSIKTEIKNKVRATAVEYYDSMSESFDYWVKTIYSESRDTVKDVWTNAEPFTQGFLEDIGGLQVIESDIEEFRLFLNQSYEANDFYVKTVVNFTLTVLDELSIRNHIDSLPKIIYEIWQMLGESGEALRKSILWFIETVKSSYNKAIDLIGRLFHGEALEHVTAVLERGVAKYDQIVKDLHVKFIKYVERMWTRISDTLVKYWQRSMERIEPSLFQFIHHIESVVWNISQEIFNFLYVRSNEIVESPYFHRVSNFTQDIDRLYQDIMGNDLLTNLRKYSVLGWQFVKEKYFVLVPFGKEMNEIISELIGEIRQLYTLEPVQFLGDKLAEVQRSIEWFANEFQVERRLLQLWSIVRDKVTRFSQTALETDDKYREAKTKFVFDPDVGVLKLEQKLPMSWHAFNETPILEEIQEYRTLLDATSYFQGSNTSIWTLYYEYKQYLDPNTWLPPFKAHSLLIGSTHYMTFDRRFVSMNSPFAVIENNRKPNKCSYLLAHDFIDGNFSLLLEPSITKNKNDLISTRKLTLITEGHVLDIDIIGSAIRVGRNITNTLPVQMGDTTIYRDADLMIIESTKGFHLNCNLQFDLCWFELSGWYFGKTAGLLGNMNNELLDDLTDQYDVESKSDNSFFNSWGLELSGTCESLQDESLEEREVSPEFVSKCDSYFRSRLSFFVNCFGVVDPTPFYQMCLDMSEKAYSQVFKDSYPAHKGLCSVALAYVESCAAEQTPLRLPDTCIHCELTNGTFVPEGTFLKLERNELPNTTDVVFIVEAGQCNQDLIRNKHILHLVNSMQKDFNQINIKNNRFAVIVFGGEPPFDRPRSIVHNNQIFTDSTLLKHFFSHIRATNQSTNNDVFEAISVASKLVFRPGASKTFVLLPCSSCSSDSMRFDYSSVLQVMIEENIQLHILMDQEFPADQKRYNQAIFGIDRQHVFTKRFLKDPGADQQMRRQIQMPKKALGVCGPLAIESNGTIFTATKLLSTNGGRPIVAAPVRRFMSVFARRVAQSAVTTACQTCECSGHDTGTAYMTCTHCNFPSAALLDYGFNEDDMLEMLQPGADFDFDEDIEIFE